MTDKELQEIKSCPACGEEAFHRWGDKSYEQGVYCTRCDFKVEVCYSDYNDTDCIRVWNNQPRIEKLISEIERLRNEKSEIFSLVRKIVKHERKCPALVANKCSCCYDEFWMQMLKLERKENDE